MMNPVERKNPITGMWEADPYRPTIYHISPSGPEAILTARFPRAGEWRINLVVTATWNSRECTSCTDDDKLVVNFPDVTDCSFTGVVIPTDGFFNRSYSHIGVGEEGELKVQLANGTTLDDVKNLSWSIRSGGAFLTLTDGRMGDGSATFKAKYTPGQAVLELKSDKTGCNATVTLDVVAPSNVYHTYESEWNQSGIANGFVNYGILNTVHFEPKDVSFFYIAAGEGVDNDAERSGDFSTLHPAIWPHPINRHPLTSGNSVHGTRWDDSDEIWYLDSVRVNTNDRGAGFHKWEIPQDWIEPSSNIRHTFVPKLLQRADFDEKRTIRIQKGGEDRSGP